MDIQRLNPTQRIVGIDYGERYMGWALSDPSWRVATPLSVLDRRHQSFESRLAQYIKQYGEFAAIIMGLPLKLDGSYGPQAEKVKRFADRHGGEYNIILWDERFTSQAVTHHAVTRHVTRQSHDKHVDDLAATFMLQGFLEALHNAVE